MCVFSLSPYFFFFLQLLCINVKKVVVQPSLQYKQVETKDSIKKTISGLKQKQTKKDYEDLMEEGSNRKAFRGEMSPASETLPPEADTHTSVVL